ncbi:MAG TPA: hypothetical protein DCQ06_13655, partial [Myxococcales bacterium]|nr:hypothetical protein [Myxococcales bacterium]
MSVIRSDFAIAGGGRWAIALAQVAAAQTGRSVRLWIPDSRRRSHLRRERRHKTLVPELQQLHQGVVLDDDPAELVASSHTIIIACAASEVRQLATELSPFLDGAHVVMHAV